MAEQQVLNKHNRILISQIAFWLMVVVNFVIRKIPVEPFDTALGMAGIVPVTNDVFSEFAQQDIQFFNVGAVVEETSGRTTYQSGCQTNNFVQQPCFFLLGTDMQGGFI